MLVVCGLQENCKVKKKGAAKYAKLAKKKIVIKKKWTTVKLRSNGQAVAFTVLALIVSLFGALGLDALQRM